MKYIVYLTTNLKSKINGINRIYVGVHKTENPEIFDLYLGCGCIATRPSSYMYPKFPFQCAVKKYGPDAFRREVLFVCDTKEEAFKKEAEIVDEQFIKQSHVYNIALGGHGGEIVPPREHSLPIYQFDLNGNLVNSWETTVDAADFYEYDVQKITKASNAKYECIGYYWSRDLNINLKQYKTGHKKYTYLYNSDGKMLTEFISRTKCADFIGCCPQSVSKALRDQQPIKGYYVSDKLVDIFIPKPRVRLRNQTFYLYNVNNEFLGQYNGSKSILSVLDINSSKKLDTIINSNNGWYKNYYISTKQIDKVPNKALHNKLVDVYTKEGKFIETLQSVKDVKEKYNINNAEMTKILKGIKYHKQYIFKYSK